MNCLLLSSEPLGVYSTLFDQRKEWTPKEADEWEETEM